MIADLSKPLIREEVNTTDQIKILYIEDNPGDRRLFSEMLLKDRSANYFVEHCPNLECALDEIKENDFDVILSDLNLPDSNGLNTIKSLLDSEFNKPVIALTMDDNDVSGLEALQSGAHDFLVKGKIKPNDLRRSINYALERKKLQDQVSYKEKVFKTAFEQSAVGMGHIDLEGKWTLVNNSLCKILNFRKSDLLNSNLNDIIYDDDKQDYSEFQSHLLENGLEKLTFESRLLTSHNFPVWANVTISVVKDENSNPHHFFAVIENITMRKRIEHALWEREKQFRSIFEQAAVGMAHVSLSGKIVKANKKLLDILKCDKIEPEETLFNDFIHPEYLDIDVQSYKDLLANRLNTYSIEKRLKKENGKPNWINITSSCMNKENGNPEYLIYIVEDITQRREVEEALKESEKNLSLVFNQIPSAIAISSLEDGIYKKINAAFTDILEYNPEEVIGKSADDLGLVVNPGEKEKILEAVKDNKVIRNQEIELRSKSGRKITGLISANLLNLHGKPHLLTVTEDITERKIASDKIKSYAEELEKNAQNLDDLNKSLGEANESKDKLFSIISHDLRSPFEPLLGLSSLLYENVESLPKEEIKEYSERINYSLRKLHSLVDNLLQWSAVTTKRIEPVKEIFNITKMIDDNIEIHKLKAKRKEVVLAKKLDEEELLVYADSNMINTVLRNLISNAVKFSNAGGIVEIFASKEGDYVKVSVKDDGIGIKQSDLPKIFSAGSKIVTEGTSFEKGTGLGLVLSREFIILNEGQIRVESELNNGSTFTFTLPVPN